MHDPFSRERPRSASSAQAGLARHALAHLTRAKDCALAFARFSLWGLALVTLGCGGLAATAGPQTLAIMPGVMNRPDNKSLRFALLKYGLESFCQEMIKRGAPLRLHDDDPTIGRFFPLRCDTRLVDDESAKSFLVQFSGAGYAFTNVTQRIGFDSAGVVEYDPDFLLDDATMYLYFRTKHVAATSFQATMIENPAASAALVMAPGGFADKFGQQIVSAELTRGFTVIRRADGSVDFGLGIVEKGKAPFHPYQIQGDSKVVLANERIEVHGGEREFLGPFEVDAQGKALFLTASVDGATSVSLYVVPKDVGDQWLSVYIHQANAPPPSVPPLLSDVVAAVTPYRKALPVAKGRYYVIVDNLRKSGPSGTILSIPLADDRAALVNYAVQVGDAP